MGPRPRLLWLRSLYFRTSGDILPLVCCQFYLKMWLLRSFSGPEKGIVLSTGQREDFEARWLCGASQAPLSGDSDVYYGDLVS